MLKLCAQAQSLLDSAVDAVLLVDRGGRILLANAKAELLFRAPGGMLLGQPVEVLVPEARRGEHERRRSEYLHAPEAREMGARANLAARRLDGTEFVADVNLAPVVIDGRQVVMASVRDMTWRARLLEEVAESERQLRDVVEGASEVFYTVSIDPDPLRGRLEYVSPQCAQLTGLPPEAFIEDPACWFRLVHPDDRAGVEASTAAIVSGRSELTRYYRIQDGRGGYRHVADRVDPILDPSGAVVGLRGVARDVTERTEAEAERTRIDERLREAERMEALGRLAGGVAHDFNNLLTAILGFSEAALAEVAPDSQAHVDLEEVTAAARRAADLTRQLLGFSRKQVVMPKSVDLREHLAALKPLLHRTASERIGLVLDLPEGLWPAWIDPVQVDQVVINLVANARDAVEGTGEVKVRVANRAIDAAFCAGHEGARPGDYVLVEVSDTGGGMDEATRANAFKPFFTTKAEGVGTGLGLASVFGIATQNGGFVTIETEVGRGTAVRVFLPRYTGETEPATPVPVPGGVIGAEGRTVLLVEDEPQVRLVTRRLLEGLGCRVLAASGPAEALQLFEAHRDEIGMLMTDVILPEMSGPALALRLRNLRPGLPVLLASGYSDRSESELSSFRHYITKPFDQAALASAVRNALYGEGGK